MKRELIPYQRKSMVIHSCFKEYEVRMEQDFSFLEKLILTENTEFVIDSRVYRLYQGLFAGIPEDRLILVEAREENKVIETALTICEQMTKIPAKRAAHLVSVGGGIIQDITGFVANILYRGIAWNFVPTTLLSACDSCIGGKTSLNYDKYKNLLGTFYPPDMVHICPAFFKTLSEADFKSGLGEVVKFGIIAGPEGMKTIEADIGRLLSREEAALTEAVKNSLAFKKKFIEADEFDRGERIKLNFAHTFGHAIETVTGYRIPHGTAVAIGMIMADRVAVKRGMLSEETASRSEKVLLQVIRTAEDLSVYPADSFIDAMRKDKKQTGDSLTAVLINEKAGDLEIVHDLGKEEAADAFVYFNRLYQPA